MKYKFDVQEINKKNLNENKKDKILEIIQMRKVII